MKELIGASNEAERLLLLLRDYYRGHHYGYYCYSLFVENVVVMKSFSLLSLLKGNVYRQLFYHHMLYLDKLSAMERLKGKQREREGRKKNDTIAKRKKYDVIIISVSYARLVHKNKLRKRGTRHKLEEAEIKLA